MNLKKESGTDSLMGYIQTACISVKKKKKNQNSLPAYTS